VRYFSASLAPRRRPALLSDCSLECNQFFAGGVSDQRPEGQHHPHSSIDVVRRIGIYVLGLGSRPRAWHHCAKPPPDTMTPSERQGDSAQSFGPQKSRIQCQNPMATHL